MNELLISIERQLLAAVRKRAATRRARRRRWTLVVVVAVGLLGAVSGASAISGRGPIAEVLGVQHDDPTLRHLGEPPGAPRGVVRVRGEDGHVYTFVAFHAAGPYSPGGRGEPSICFTQTRDDAKRIPGLGCGTPVRIAAELRRSGIVGGSAYANAHAGSLRLTRTGAGLVPGDTRWVSLRREGEPSVDAKLSRPFPLSLGRPTQPRYVRAFLAIASHDADGHEWLGGPITETITVVSGDGSPKELTFEDQPFFPMTRGAGPGRPRVRMRLAARPAPWLSLAYIAKDGTFCTSAAPPGERLAKPTLRQCSSQLAVLSALARYGAAVYFSNPNPLRERGPRSMAVFGFARADATAVTITNQRGRRFHARLSRPWATAVRRRGSLAGTRDGLRRRLKALPRRMRLRSYITSIRLPPRPSDGRGLRLRVLLRDGTQLTTGAR